MKTVVIIQARAASTRFPRKVLAPLCGKPLLQHVIDRVKMSHVDEVILAIPDSRQNDALVAFGPCYRRDHEDDVLARYYGAALAFKAEVIVRVCGDSPLVDPILIDRLLESKAEYARCIGYPRGAMAWMFSLDTLCRANTHANTQYQREHVCPWMEDNIHIKGEVRNPGPPSGYNYSVDTPADLERVARIIDQLGSRCTTAAIIELLDAEPGLGYANA